MSDSRATKYWLSIVAGCNMCFIKNQAIGCVYTHCNSSHLKTPYNNYIFPKYFLT